mmetsp:Transcript_25970/g.27071  ORF Transcript_25970/g.27071 Transcript_25970/m.27071 type:complete len:763 (+) Transcript_25970:46-2334(+)
MLNLVKRIFTRIQLFDPSINKEALQLLLIKKLTSDNTLNVLYEEYSANNHSQNKETNKRDNSEGFPSTKQVFSILSHSNQERESLKKQRLKNSLASQNRNAKKMNNQIFKSIANKPKPSSKMVNNIITSTSDQNKSEMNEAKSNALNSLLSLKYPGKNNYINYYESYPNNTISHHQTETPNGGGHQMMVNSKLADLNLLNDKNLLNQPEVHNNYLNNNAQYNNPGNVYIGNNAGLGNMGNLENTSSQNIILQNLGGHPWIGNLLAGAHSEQSRQKSNGEIAREMREGERKSGGDKQQQQTSQDNNKGNNNLGGIPISSLNAIGEISNLSHTSNMTNLPNLGQIPIGNIPNLSALPHLFPNSIQSGPPQAQVGNYSHLGNSGNINDHVFGLNNLAHHPSLTLGSQMNLPFQGIPNLSHLPPDQINQLKNNYSINPNLMPFPFQTNEHLINTDNIQTTTQQMTGLNYDKEKFNDDTGIPKNYLYKDSHVDLLMESFEFLSSEENLSQAIKDFKQELKQREEEEKELILQERLSSTIDTVTQPNSKFLKKCENKICTVSENKKNGNKQGQWHKIKLFSTKKSITICGLCYKAYKSKQFCYYCGLIYKDSFCNQDTSMWIECHKCKSWHHVACEEQKGSYYKDIQKLVDDEHFEYTCFTCRDSKDFKEKKKKPSQNNNSAQKKSSINDFNFFQANEMKYLGRKSKKSPNNPNIYDFSARITSRGVKKNANDSNGDNRDVMQDIIKAMNIVKEQESKEEGEGKTSER